MVGGQTEEARAYLQDRLEVLSKVLFWGLGGVVLFSGGLIYELYPDIRPALATEVFVGSMAGVIVLGLTWRFALVGRSPSRAELLVIDVFYAIGTGIGIACSAYFAPEVRAAGYTALLLTIFVIITRAIIVPSTAARTATVSVLTCAPVVAAALGLALARDQDVPGPIYVIGAIVLMGVAVVLAATGSGVMYGLRKQADAGVQVGQYTLGRKIGEGGMGVVYYARHVLLRRPTAVKLVLPHSASAETLDRFEREVQHTSQLTHPNTVAVFDYGRATDGTFYYAMEYLDGVDLDQLVRRFGPQPPGRVVRVLVQVCGALQEAHDRGIIHRDIKPANIILCERGANADVAKVVDFGLVKEIAPSAVTTTTQTVMGTPAYLAPESITTPEVIGAPADLYALGAVGYFLLSGRAVFEGANALDVCLKHVTTAPAPLSPSRVADVIMRCLAKQPDQRYASATELATALHDADPRDWDDTRAQQWWSEHAASNESALSLLPTKTLQIGARR